MDTSSPDIHRHKYTQIIQTDTSSYTPIYTEIKVHPVIHTLIHPVIYIYVHTLRYTHKHKYNHPDTEKKEHPDIQHKYKDT